MVRKVFGCRSVALEKKTEKLIAETIDVEHTHGVVRRWATDSAYSLVSQERI